MNNKTKIILAGVAIAIIGGGAIILKSGKNVNQENEICREKLRATLGQEIDYNSSVELKNCVLRLVSPIMGGGKYYLNDPNFTGTLTIEDVIDLSTQVDYGIGIKAKNPKMQNRIEIEKIETSEIEAEKAKKIK